MACWRHDHARPCFEVLRVNRQRFERSLVQCREVFFQQQCVRWFMRDDEERSPTPPTRCGLCFAGDSSDVFNVSGRCIMFTCATCARPLQSLHGDGSSPRREGKRGQFFLGLLDCNFGVAVQLLGSLRHRILRRICCRRARWASLRVLCIFAIEGGVEGVESVSLLVGLIYLSCLRCPVLFFRVDLPLTDFSSTFLGHLSFASGELQQVHRLRQVDREGNAPRGGSHGP